MRRWAVLLVGILLGTVSCADADHDDAAGGATATAEEAGDAPVVADTAAGPEIGIERASQVLGGRRSVIRTAEVEIEVEDVHRAVRAAVRIAESGGGFLAEEESAEGDDATARLVLRVPPDRFSATLDELRALGEVVRTRVGSDDVTEVVVDVEGRLAGARASVERLRALLAEASDIPGIVAVESELARREGEVESLAGRLQALEAQVDLATVTVQLRGPASAGDPATGQDSPGFLAGLRTGWAAFVTVAGGLATGAGFALPFLAVAAALAGASLWWRRRTTAASSG